jgi:Flp pilus assembly protein TadD
MSRRVALLAFVLAAVTTAPPSIARAAKLWERDWREIKTAHFVIASALPEKRSVELAEELEHFRTVVMMISKREAADAFEERIPTNIYVLPKAIPDLGLDGRRVGGYMHPGMRANYAVIMEAGDYASVALKHEYVHFLTHNHGAQLYPPWFDEGTAEVLSTLTVHNGIIEYGKPMPERVAILTHLSWMSFPKLLTYRDTQSVGIDQLGQFYAQSWLLMQYLMIGREGHSFTADATDFLRRTEAGQPQLESFEAAFGIDPDHLKSMLEAYTRKMHYFRSTPVNLPAVEPQIRKMGVDEVAAGLGLLALIHENFGPAETYYAAALAANPNNASALAGMGDVHKHAGRFDEAERSYALAVAAEPGNANHELDWGEYFLHRAGAADAGSDEHHAFLIEARKHFARSFKINPQNPETLDQNALTYLFEGKDSSKAVASLEAAYDLLPSNEQIQGDLAAAYVSTGQTDLARQMLRRLLAWSHGDATDSIKKLLVEIDASDTSSKPANERVATDSRNVNE